MIYIMRKDVAIMNNRNQQKAQSLQRILQAAGLRLRQEGLSGAAIATVMQDAGLTHGAFYVHFANKSQLSAAALRHALLDNRKRWVNRLPHSLGTSDCTVWLSATLTNATAINPPQVAPWQR